MITVALQKTNKRDARLRYNSGLPIGVTNDHYDDGFVGQAFTRDSMGGLPFDKLVERTTDRRRPTALYWWEPAPDLPAAEQTDEETRMPTGFKTYQVIVTPSGEVLMPESCWVVDTDALTVGELRAAIKHSTHLGKVMDQYGARNIGDALKPTTPQD